MFAPTMFLRLLGPVELLMNELESTPSSSVRAGLIRKLALCHDPAVIPTIAPFLAAERRVRGAAIEGILHFGEEARASMLDILGDRTRSALHPAALRVLAALVGGSTSRRGRSSGPRRGGLESTGGYASTMNAVRGRVRGGHVEVDTVLPDGAEVVVFVPGVEPPFELSEEDSTELQDRLRELDRGGGTAAEEVFERLRPKG